MSEPTWKVKREYFNSLLKLFAQICRIKRNDRPQLREADQYWKIYLRAIKDQEKLLFDSKFFFIMWLLNLKEFNDSDFHFEQTRYFNEITRNIYIQKQGVFDLAVFSIYGDIRTEIHHMRIKRGLHVLAYDLKVHYFEEFSCEFDRKEDHSDRNDYLIFVGPLYNHLYRLLKVYMHVDIFEIIFGYLYNPGKNYDTFSSLINFVIKRSLRAWESSCEFSEIRSRFLKFLRSPYFTLLVLKLGLLKKYNSHLQKLY